MDTSQAVNGSRPYPDDKPVRLLMMLGVARGVPPDAVRLGKAAPAIFEEARTIVQEGGIVKALRAFRKRTLVPSNPQDRLTFSAQCALADAILATRSDRADA